MLTEDLGIEEHSLGTISWNLGFWMLGNTNTKVFVLSWRSPYWLVFTVLEDAMHGGWGRKGINNLTELWTLGTMTPTCQAKCTQLHCSGMAVMEVTQHLPDWVGDTLLTSVVGTVNPIQKSTVLGVSWEIPSCCLTQLTKCRTTFKVGIYTHGGHSQHQRGLFPGVSSECRDSWRE